MIILGVDPGTTRVGYGLIKKEGKKLSHLKSGLLKIKSTRYGSRLVELSRSFENLLKKHRPDVVALEQLYFMKNRKTALDVSQARGVLMLLVVKSGLKVRELAPSTIKKAVTGYGLASKKDVAKMVGYFLKINVEDKLDDVTDALAIAIVASEPSWD